MGENSGIQWTTHTWNPFQGCAKVSPGCDHCYMFRDKRRYGQDPEKVVRSKPPTFNKPLRWQRETEAARNQLSDFALLGPVYVFLASWTDFFIADADEWRPEAWEIIKKCPDLTFQILTKRHARIAKNLPPDWGDGYPNVWLGVSAENAEWWNRRVPVLRDVPAHTRFVSYEPALGSIAGCSAEGMDWVIIGGESGHNESDSRPFQVEWAREALDICRRDGAAPFVKQLGRDARLGDGMLHLPVYTMDNGEMDLWPEDIRVREYPR